MAKRRHFSREFKAKIAIEAIKGLKTVVNLVAIEYFFAKIPLKQFDF
jgi:hypothetical protein